jgi:uncharacterized protein
MKRVAIVVAVLASLSVPAAARAAGTRVLPEVTSGYITTAPGVHLHYAVIRPSKHGRFPVAMIYGPYGEGADPITVGSAPAPAKALLAAGFAVLGVNVRGTGCSSGVFDPFKPHEARDGARAVEWAAAQPWSNGRVGMFGLSAPGITQFGVAGQRPPHLRAIAPSQFLADFYRDGVYAGGLLDVTFPPLWAFGLQPAYSHAKGGGYPIAHGDARCARNVAARQRGAVQANLLFPVLKNRFDNAVYAERNPNRYAAQINVPTMACVSWQDDALLSRGSAALDQLDPAKTWIIGVNGYHGICDDQQFLVHLVRFMDHFVKGKDNGFDKTPHVMLAHEAHFAGGRNKLPGAKAPQSESGWVTTHPSWPVPVVPVAYRLGGGTYHYPLASSGNEDGYSQGNMHALWKVRGTTGGFVNLTTDTLREDTEFLGPGSANLWLKSTAADTDIQITLSEIRPDGQEMYVQRGWLRASHRKLDPVRSTALRPFHTHHEADVRPLTPGEPTLLRVELWPFNHVFRAGSRIRLAVDAPTANTGLFAFNFLKQPAINTVVQDSMHQSELVLGRVVGGRAPRPYGACDTVISQPCRPVQLLR